jgi:hypothetical protein
MTGHDKLIQLIATDLTAIPKDHELLELIVSCGSTQLTESDSRFDLFSHLARQFDVGDQQPNPSFKRQQTMLIKSAGCVSHRYIRNASISSTLAWLISTVMAIIIIPPCPIPRLITLARHRR